MDSEEIIKKVLLEGRSSSENYNCTQEPFFSMDSNNQTNIKYVSDEVDSILEKYDFPEDLRKIYRGVGNKLVEYYYKDWVLLSLSNIEERVDIYRKDGQNRVIDFGVKYHGMGHCYVVAFYPEDKKIFYRRDGGANGYERMAHYREIVEYKPITEHKFEVMDWLWYIDSETKEFPLMIN